MNAPNFLLIMTDQHRADHLGCYGNRVLRTPQLDALAARATLFERCYATSPICMPNRAALLTGRMPSINGIRHNGVPLPREAVTVADVLRSAGYRTALIGKAHLQTQGRREVPDPLLFAAATAGRPPPAELAQALRTTTDRPEYLCEREDTWTADESYEVPRPYYGFEHVELACGHGDRLHGHYLRWARARCPDLDRLRGPSNALAGRPRSAAPQAWRTAVPEEAFPARFVEERTIALLEQMSRESPRRPFLLQCSFPEPHHPFTPPGRWWDLYAPGDVALPRSHGHVDPEEPALLTKLRSLHRDPRFVPGPFCTQMIDADAARAAIALTYGMVSMVDESIGRVLAALARLQLDRDTIVIFTSDHGDFLGDHSLVFKQGFHYEGVIRVPLLWMDPQRPASRYLRPVSSLDIPASILARAGLAPPAGTQGIDVFSGVHRDAVAIEEDELRIHMGELGPTRLWSLVDDRWRLTIWYGEPRGELFDRADDPDELRNRWSDPGCQVVKARMMERLLHERMRLADTLPHALRSA